MCMQSQLTKLIQYINFILNILNLHLGFNGKFMCY